MATRIKNFFKKKKFNILLSKAVRNKKLIIRSCWVCNPAHEHLKTTTSIIYCFSCGHYYFQGVDLSGEV